MKAAETGERACLGAEMFDGCAYLGGDWLLLNKEEVGFDNLCLLGLLVWGEERSVDFVGVGGLSLKGCGSRSLDHGESGHDITVGVRNLAVGY